MSGWLTYVMLTIGLTYLVTQASITAPLRIVVTRGSVFRSALFYCPSCTGFWVGAALYLLGLGPWGHAGIHPASFFAFSSAGIQVAIIAMATAHIWSAITQQGVNPAWEAELPLREPEGPTPNAPQKE